MKFKSTLSLIVAMLPVACFSADYFVKPAAVGDADGSSWDNAMSFENFYTRLNTSSDGFADGDAFYFAGGNYIIPSVSVVSPTAKGYTLIGGYNPSLTGTEKTIPTDFDTYRTVFSGDRNGDGMPNGGDARCIFAFQLNTAHHAGTRRLCIQGIDFCYVYTEDATNENGNRKGALCIDNSGDVEIKNCRFYKNVLTKGGSAIGGAALLNYRSTIHVTDCEFTENKAVARGAAIRVTSNANTKGNLILERCLIANNEVTEGTGSAICVQNACEIDIVNCTITGNKSASNGAVFVNGATNDYPNEVVNIVCSTIAGNECGAEIQFNTGAPRLNVLNSIIAPVEGKTAIVTGVSTENTRYSIVSGGYNIIGAFRNSVTTDATFPAQDTDSQDADNIATTVFASLNIVDGVLAPLDATAAGASLTTLSTAVGEMSLKENVDVTVDQQGTVRTDNMMPGAYGKIATTSGISIVQQAKAVNSRYSSIFDLQGRRVMDMEKGIYIVNGKKVFVSR